ncbi:MAG: hypothetical protein NTW87_09390, partial [Planctomycetota bacterium]|nr:hypothetical protein [Planctomycetota bacterium]
MAIRVQCPKCKLPQEVSDNAAGKVAECVGCKAKFPVPGKKTCTRCGKDLTHAKRSKDQFGRYYCADCVHLVAARPSDRGTAIVGPPAAGAPPPSVTPAASPAPPAPVAPPAPAEAAARPAPAAPAPEPLELMPVQPAAAEAAAKPAGRRGHAYPAPSTETPASLPAAAQSPPSAAQPPPVEPPAPSPVEPSAPLPVGIKVVCRPLKSIQWPKRCVGCFAENPTETMPVNVLRATKMGRGAGLVGAMVRGLTGRIGVKAKGETPRFDLPVCADCCTKMVPERLGALNGKNDGALPPPLRVETPLLVREIERQCVVLTVFNQDYATAFEEANPGQVFGSVEECEGASLEEVTEPTVPPAAAPAAQPAAPPAQTETPPEQPLSEPAPAAAPAPPPEEIAPGDILGHLARTHLPAGEV